MFYFRAFVEISVTQELKARLVYFQSSTIICHRAVLYTYVIVVSLVDDLAAKNISVARHCFAIFAARGQMPVIGVTELQQLTQRVVDMTS